MKVQAILEFDLEDWDGSPVDDRELFDLAVQDTELAISSRLMGEGFLEGDALLGTWTPRVSVLDEAGGDPAPP